MEQPNYSTIEHSLEQHVLANYDLPSGATTWHAHNTIGPDDTAHYFTRDTSNYVLVCSDHPNPTFIHEESLPSVHVNGGKDEWLHIDTGELTGYYSLYIDTPAR